MPEAIEPRPLTAGFFRLILRRFGDTPAARAAILEGTGIGEDEIDDNAPLSITVAQQIQQFENVERLNGEGWALIAPDLWRPVAHGALGDAVISASTVGAALEILAKYISARAPNQRLQLVRGSTSVSLCHSVAAELPPNHLRTIVEAVFLGVGSTLSALLGHAETEIRFEFMWPERSYGPRLQEALRGQIRWSAPANAIVIPKRLLALRSPLADAVVHQHALERLAQAAALGGAPGVRDRVEQLLARSDTGRLLLPQVASSLGLSQRTLARRLADARVSYRDLADAELKARAERLLEAGALSKGEIGERLGFADATGFSRATRRWSGASASGRDFEFTLDRDWRIVSISEGAAVWSGSKPDDLVGRDSREVWPPEPTQLTEAIEAAFAGGASSTVEHPSLMIPGRWVKVDVEPSKDGARLRFEDITSRVRLGPGPAEIVLLDRNGVIVAANAAWRASVVAFGLKLAEAGVGARYALVAKAVAGTDEVVFQNRLEELFSGRLQEFEATFSQDGASRSERRQVRITPLRSGDATYFMAVHENLTERARILAALHETSDQLLHAQEKERERIAIELHDSVGQNQAAMVLGLAQLRKRLAQDSTARAVLDDMSKMVDENIHHTRVLSYLMNASGGERVGLEASVRRLVDGFCRRAGLGLAFEAQGPVDAISAAAQHAVFRVVEEALSNVYRHAHAKKVSVKLVSRTGELSIRIADDGRGFQLAPGVHAAERPLGVGIAGMRARIEQLGGLLEIVGGASGTSVTAAVPLRS